MIMVRRSPMSERPFTLTTPDGVTLDCILSRPAGVDDKAERTVLLVHGITADLEESGAFSRLAKMLASSGTRTVRFSFRGHGKSSLPSEFMTCSGEAIDLRTMVDYCLASYGPNLSIVAASFGAVSVAVLAEYLNRRIQSLCLWNPVLDIDKTFLRPTLPWGVNNFTGKNLASLYESGYLIIDDSFKVGIIFWEELRYLGSYDGLQRLDAPVLLIHGDVDNYVPYTAALTFARTHPRANLVTIAGADHGFELEHHERQVLQETVVFLSSLK